MSEPQVLVVGYSVVPTVQVLNDGVLSPPVNGIEPQFFTLTEWAGVVEATEASRPQLEEAVLAAYAAWQDAQPKPNRARRAKPKP